MTARLALSTKRMFGAVALGIGALWALPVAGQSPPVLRTNTAEPSATRPLAAGLLRRLAEAADGYRTGRPVWVVASRQLPYDVAAVYPDSATAYRVAQDSNLALHDSVGLLWGAFGPFVTPRDLGHLPVIIIAPPKHCWPTIMCRDALWQIPDTSWLAQDVDSIGITVYHHSGRTLHGKVNPKEVDAIFFSLSAIDKFVIPYYTAISGPEYALRLRESIVSGIHF